MKTYDDILKAPGADADIKSDLPYMTIKAEREQLIQLLLDRGWTQNVDFFEPPGADPKIQHIYTLVAAIKSELKDDDR